MKKKKTKIRQCRLVLSCSNIKVCVKEQTHRQKLGMDNKNMDTKWNNTTGHGTARHTNTRDTWQHPTVMSCCGHIPGRVHPVVMLRQQRAWRRVSLAEREPLFKQTNPSLNIGRALYACLVFHEQCGQCKYTFCLWNAIEFYQPLQDQFINCQ